MNGIKTPGFTMNVRAVCNKTRSRMRPLSRAFATPVLMDFGAGKIDRGRSSHLAELHRAIIDFYNKHENLL